MTGIRYPGPDISLKRLEILLEIVPHAKRILLPYDRNTTLITSQLESVRLATKSSNITPGVILILFALGGGLGSKGLWSRGASSQCFEQLFKC